MSIDVFISHAHADAELAREFEGFLNEISHHNFKISRSSKAGNIEYGDNWIEWINERVQTAQITFVLLTPSSFSGKWVLWEAGAVSGVKCATQGASKEEEKKVIPVTFNIGAGEDLGPFKGIQTSDGVNAEKMEALADVLLDYLKSKGALQPEQYRDRLKKLPEICRSYVNKARAALERLQVSRSEDLIQEWISRLDMHLEARNYGLVRSARRWINIAFLGSEKADEATPIDFRIHSRLAAGFQALGQWDEAKAQLELAKRLSPRDMMILRELGRAELELKHPDAAREIFNKMREFDGGIFSGDEEALMLSVRIYMEKREKAEALKEIKNAAKLAETSPYVLSMLSILTILVDGPDPAIKHFEDLRKLETRRAEKDQDFWSVGNLVNAALGLGDEKEADRHLARLKEMPGASEKRDSISRYFDEIIGARKGFVYDWRAKWPGH